MRLRRCVHRGSVLAAALHVEGPARVLALWRPGCVVETCAGGYEIRFAEARRMAAARAPGTPLVALGGMLAGAPLDADELARAAAPAGSVLLSVGGELRVVPSAERQVVDPSAWIDLAGYARPHAATLGEPPPPIAVEAPASQPARARFSVPAPVASVEGLVQAVMAAAAARARRPPAEGHPYRTPPPRDEVFASRLGLGVVALAGVIAVALVAPALVLPAAALVAAAAAAGRLTPKSSRPPAPNSAPRPVEDLPPPPPPGPARDSAWRRLSRWLSRLATRGSLARTLGRRHAQYLDELLELLDRGDADEALRRAIPLGRGPGGSPAWGMPGRRDKIRINPVPLGGGASSIYADDPILAALRQRYRALFERLDAQGRIDEAAFVLGELLGDWAEAVTYLERHGRLRLAAEVAEGHRLDAGLVIHLWLKAGDRARAVHLARTRNAFAAAVLRLEQRRSTEDLEQIRELRLLWAEALAADGDLLGAVRAIEPVLAQLPPAERERALEWLRRGAQGEGPPAATLLASALALDEDWRPTWRARALALAADADPTLRPARFAFLRALVAQKADVSRVVARAAARRLLVEAETLAPAARLALDLARHASDPVLLADLPALATPADPPLATPLRHRVEARDRGQLPAHDAMWLADGRVLVALGEIGVRVRERKGSRLIAEPAHELVASSAGTRLLALAPRDGTTRVARVDLARGTAAPWGELRLLSHAPFLRHGLWAVATGPRPSVSLLDVERDRPTSIFQVSDVGDQLRALAHDDGGLAFVVAGNLEETLWRYDGSLVLRERCDFRPPGDPVTPFVATSGSGKRAALSMTLGMRLAYAPSPTAPFGWAHVADTRDALDLVLGGDFLALSRAADAGIIVEVWGTAPQSQHVVVELAGAARVRVRLLPREGERNPALILADDLGRVLACDLVTGTLPVDLRT